MATIKLTDSFGFVTDVQLKDKGAIDKYFKPLPEAIKASKLNLTTDGAATLSTIRSATDTLDVGTAVQVGSGPSVDLEIKATSSGTVSIFSPLGGKPANLFDPDQFADPILVQPNQCYVSTAFNATVEGDAGAKVGDLKYGMNANSGITLSYYQLFDTGLGALTLRDAICETIGNYIISGDLDDIAAMPENSVAAVDGTGDLKFSGKVSLSSFTNAPLSVPLATVGPVQITAGGNFTVAAGFEYSGEYQVRVTRLARGLFQLGVYRKKGSTFTLTASASGGLSAGLGQNDLFGEILKQISADPTADVKELAGLPPDRIVEIQKVVKQSVDRTLSLGISAQIGVDSETEAMFLYEIDLAQVTAEGRVLIHAALEGDFGPLVSTDTAPPAGISVLKTLISSAKTLTYSLKVNVFGIYNVARISDLILKGATAWDSMTGQLVLTDTATASLIGMNTLNFGVDTHKLRKLLSEQFLLSAAYTASKAIQAPPRMCAQHMYFEFDAHSHRVDIRNDLFLGVAFGLLSSPSALAKLPAGVSSFDETTVLAETDYDDAAVEKLFLDNDLPRNPEDYESAGLRAITFMVQPGDDDDFRLLPAKDPSLWSQMKGIGNVRSAEFVALIQGRAGVSIAPNVIAVDYLNIVWWRDAMHACAVALAAMRSFISLHPGMDPNNHDFLAKKRELANSLKKVAATTREDFGGPWGMIATHLLLTPPSASAKSSLVITDHLVSVAY